MLCLVSFPVRAFLVVLRPRFPFLQDADLSFYDISVVRFDSVLSDARYCESLIFLFLRLAIDLCSTGQMSTGLKDFQNTDAESDLPDPKNEVAAVACSIERALQCWQSFLQLSDLCLMI